MFFPEIGRNVEVYVGDMLVKSLDEQKHLDDLKETFDTFRQYNMKLNPASALSEFRWENSLGSWFHIGELKRILTKFRQSWILSHR